MPTNIPAVERLASIWRANRKDVLDLAIPENCKEFRDYYDSLQAKISKLDSQS